jgi:hypothetical protein
LDVADRIGGQGAVGDEPNAVGRETTVDVTRYLAAAAYLDETFRDEVIVQTLYEKYRFIAPSYGVNIGSVVRHCIASRRLSRRRDVILSVLLVIGLWALHLPLLFEVGVFAVALIVAIALSSPKTKLRWRVVLSVVAYFGIAAFVLHPLSFLTALAAWFVVAADRYERRYRVVGKRINSKPFNPADSAYGRERPHERAADDRRTAHLAAQQDGNVVAYSGFSPFRGSGLEMEKWSWSIAIDVTQAREGWGKDRPPDRIETTELYSRVIDSMNHLGVEDCTAVDRFYVNGRHVGADKELFFHPLGPGDGFRRLRYQIDDVPKLETKPAEVVRRYVDIKVMSWESELILSAFVRFSRHAHYLFVETSYFVLLPLKPSYHDMGGFNPQPTPHELLRIIGDSTTGTPLLWLQAPLRVVKWMAHPASRARQKQQVGQAIRENRRFDYGATGSVRESGSDDGFPKYFQIMDVVKFHSIVDRYLLATVSAILKENGVNTSELERNIQFVIRRGIFIDNKKGNVLIGDHGKINDSSGADSNEDKDEDEDED